MDIWRVAPQNPTASPWKQNVSIPAAIVRAPDEHTARLFGMTALNQYLEDVPRHGTRWESPTWVTCEQVVNSNYPTEGDCEILYP
jgi:hypothetical protein